MRKVDIYISHREYAQDGRWITLHPHGNNNNGEKDYKRIFIDDDGTIEKGIFAGTNIKDLGKRADGEKKKGKSSDGDKQSEKPKARLFKADELPILEKSFKSFRQLSTGIDKKVKATTEVFERLPVGTEIAATLGSGQAVILRKTAIDENGEGEWRAYQNTSTGELRELISGHAYATDEIARCALHSIDGAKFSYRDHLPKIEKTKKRATTKPAIAPKSTATPQSLKNYDKKSKQFNEDERKRRKGGVTEEQAKEVSNELARIIENSDFCMNRSLRSFKLILKDGRFKNLFETGTSSGSTSTYAREKTEKQLFGIEGNIKPEERPKYGYMCERGVKDTKTADWYGDGGEVRIKFKRDRVIQNATYTLGDSLDYYKSKPELVAGRVANPSLAGLDAVGCGDNYDSHCKIDKTINALKGYKDGSDFAKKNGYSDKYLEVQYHGKLTVDDIEEVTFERGLNVPKTVIKELDKRGIKYSYV